MGVRSTHPDYQIDLVGSVPQVTEPRSVGVTPEAHPKVAADIGQHWPTWTEANTEIDRQ